MAKYRDSKFKLVGKFEGFVTKGSNKIKALKIKTADGKYKIKVPKKIRHNLYLAVSPGCWLEVKGKKSENLKNGKVKFQAKSVQRRDNSLSQTETPVPQPAIVKPKKSKESILVCKKSSCWKRGGKEVCQVIEENLRNRGLEDQVNVKLTGCLKKCKKGPNVVMMPDKALYSKVKPKEIATLVEEHFVKEESKQETHSVK